MKFVFAAIAATVTAGSAFAGGYVAPVVEPAPVVAVTPVAVSNDGDWTGFYAGLQYGQGNFELSDDTSSVDSDFDAYGLHGGYQHDFGKYVLGGELDYNKLDLDEVEGDGDLTRLRGRAGYDMGRFQPYATLGVAHLSTDDLSETGITYGVGAEFKATERLSVGAEYTMNDFSDVDNVDGLDVDTDMVQLRASFRF